ncbi:MAG: aldehyde ferredoxin oxidoreductase, partial [Actinobacteria bacterium]|nr:aldehyde ferredoxin oxidoreductase [Actinomycetota bacterium]
DLTFLEGIDLGRRIWTLDNAIWILQGRHRDMVQFAPYIYDIPLKESLVGPFYPMAGKVDGKWAYINTLGRSIDRDGFEEWKTHFYNLEGWDTTTGWPTRDVLEELDMADVATVLEDAKKLGGM